MYFGMQFSCVYGSPFHKPVLVSEPDDIVYILHSFTYIKWFKAAYFPSEWFVVASQTTKLDIQHIIYAESVSKKMALSSWLLTN